MDDQSTLPSSYRSFVAYGGYDEPYAPAFKKLLVTEVDTHTHTVPLCGARAERYLKSLRNKRKKHRKSSASTLELLIT